MTEREEQIFRDGFRMGVLAEQSKRTEPTHRKSMGAMGERRFRIVPTDQHTARILNFPTTEKTAS